MIAKCRATVKHLAVPERGDSSCESVTSNDAGVAWVISTNCMKEKSSHVRLRQPAHERFFKMFMRTTPLSILAIVF